MMNNLQNLILIRSSVCQIHILQFHNFLLQIFRKSEFTIVTKYVGVLKIGNSNS